MAEAFSKELRRDVLRDCDAGLGTRAVALKYSVSESWVRRCKQQRRETGQVEAKRTRDRVAGWHDWAGWLKATVEAQPDIYLREIQSKLKAELGVEASEEWIGKVCHMLDITRKKRR